MQILKKLSFLQIAKKGHSIAKKGNLILEIHFFVVEFLKKILGSDPSRWVGVSKCEGKFTWGVGLKNGTKKVKSYMDSL